MNVMMGFGWASIMLLLGVLLRAKVSFFKNMLVPASVIGGLIGLVFVNIMSTAGISISADSSIFNSLVSQIFTISFISISLTSTPKEEGNSAKNTLKGAWGMGLIWCFLYALTPLISYGLVAVTGKTCGMNAIYGMLIQFAFCQGPGQSATYGAIFEQYGFENAAMVAIAFSVVGFVVAFLIGIPACKAGIKRGIAKHTGTIDETVLRGYLRKEEQTAVMNRDTTQNSNVETLSFHLAIIGLCYVMAVGIGNVLGLLPGFLGTSMKSLMFMNGMYAAYIVKFIMKKLGIDFLLDNTLQTKITGWTADYLVVCAFMAISMSVISAWIFPIAVVAIVATVVTFFVCFYFGQRFGGSNDFERTLAMYGMCTGTVPTGIALVRIVDPGFKTSTAVELGACNLVMILFCTPTYMVILAFAAGSMSLGATLGSLAGISIAMLVGLKITRCWGKPSFSWK